ncbi:hypothetical protein ACFSQQ_27960 [Mesorhizobium kowhaii]|uniref:hypothetical protein n=1 Tax=Mesorhizobium kowhaii TaxID=1300272 RepID=UPI0035F04B36
MLGWALKHVEIYAPDIVAARAELDALEARCTRLMARDARAECIRERAPNAARRIDPLTGKEIPPYNLHLMRLRAGAPASGRVSQLEATGRLIDQAAAELGTEVGGLDTPISIDPVARAAAVMEVLSARNRQEKGLSSLW